MTNARSADEESEATLAPPEQIDTSWDARTQRMLARMGSAPPRPRDFATSRRPAVTRTHRLVLAQDRDESPSSRSNLSPRYGAGAGEVRKPRRCEKTGKNLKQAVPAKSSLGMAAVGVMSTSIGRAGAAAGARLGYEGMQLGSQALISLLDIAEVQVVCGALVTVLLWEASSRKLTKRPDTQLPARKQRHRRVSATAAT